MTALAVAKRPRVDGAAVSFNQLIFGARRYRAKLIACRTDAASFALHRALPLAHKNDMSTRTSVVPSVGAFLALAIGAFAVIYYGAVPWALSRAIGATFWLLGWH